MSVKSTLCGELSPSYIADLYVQGCYLNSREADHELMLLADSGLLMAQGFYALLWSNGGAATKGDYHRACHYGSLLDPHLSRELDSGLSSAEVMYLVGMFNYDGIGIIKSYDSRRDKAAQLFRQAANLGFAPAQYMFGKCYRYGCGTVSKDITFARDWYLKSAYQEYALAQYDVGCLYRDGVGVSKDCTIAEEWFLKSASQGYRVAEDIVGDSHDKQTFFREAKCWYIKSSNRIFVTTGFSGKSTGSGDASPSYISDLYVKSCYLWSADADRELMMLADIGNPLAQGFYSLIWYFGGRSTGKDSFRACYYSLRVFPRLLRALESTSSRELMYVVGYIYYEGIGITRDIVKAASFFAQSANMGHAPALRMLGDCYHRGRGFPQNDITARDWYLKSACQEYAVAQHDIGICYLNGRGVSKDDKIAEEWFLKSAN